MDSKQFADRLQKKEPLISESVFKEASNIKTNILKMGHFFSKLPYTKRSIADKIIKTNMGEEKYQVEKAVLLGSYCTERQYLSKEFIRYDTSYYVGFERNYFILPNAHLVVLIMLAQGLDGHDEVFTTCRDRYYTDPKSKVIYDNSGYYKDREGREWELRIRL
jgi:hypothetical protein